MAQSNGRDRPAISVVVPVRNEAGNIAPLAAEIAAALQGRAFEIVYVNDGSSDATEQELRGLMAERPWLRRWGPVGRVIAALYSSARAAGAYWGWASRDEHSILNCKA